MNIVTAAARELKAHPSVVSLCTFGIHKHKLLETVEGTGQVGLSVRTAGNWTRTLQTARFPRIIVLVGADPSRVGTDPVVEDAEDRALAALNAADKVLHWPHCLATIWCGEKGLSMLGS